MSTVSLTAPSAGRQELYNTGVLPNNLSSNTLKSASASQLNQLATQNIRSQQLSSLLGDQKTLTDSATLSSTATDALSQAVNNQLTSNLNAAVNKFVPNQSQDQQTAVSKINLLA